MDLDNNCIFLIKVALVQPESHQQTVIKRMGDCTICQRRHLPRRERVAISLMLQFALGRASQMHSDGGHLVIPWCFISIHLAACFLAAFVLPSLGWLSGLTQHHGL